jgi:hypothetical protein
MVLAAQDQGMVMPRDAIERAINWKFFSDESPSDQKIRTDANPLARDSYLPLGCKAHQFDLATHPQGGSAGQLAAVAFRRLRDVDRGGRAAAQSGCPIETGEFAQLEPGTERGTNGRDPARWHSRDCPMVSAAKPNGTASTHREAPSIATHMSALQEARLSLVSLPPDSSNASISSDSPKAFDPEDRVRRVRPELRVAPLRE